MEYPITRLRRLRRTAPLRALVRETRLEPAALIYPLFLCPGEGVRREVSSMPGVFNLSIDEAVKEAESAAALGIGGLLLFGLPADKDEQASGAWEEDGIVQQGIRALKQQSKLDKLVLIADVCLCEYTSHGHCGIVAKSGEAYEIENDSSLELIARTARSLAQAGADIVAPSDMMDGRVSAIRNALDEAGIEQTPILSYAAKFASAFYGPFREAADSAPQFGDRRSYQMDGANLREAMREIEQDLLEGADMVLMKPAMPYLDVIHAARERFDVPIGAYQVSGEYSMLQAAFARGWLDAERTMLEVSAVDPPRRRRVHRDLFCEGSGQSAGLRKAVSRVSELASQRVSEWETNCNGHAKAATCLDTVCSWDDRTRGSRADLWRFCDGMAAGRAVGAGADGAGLRFGRTHAGLRCGISVCGDCEVVGADSVSVSHPVGVAESTGCVCGSAD